MKQKEQKPCWGLPECSVILDVPYQTCVTWLKLHKVKPSVKQMGRMRFGQIELFQLAVIKSLYAQGLSRQSVDCVLFELRPKLADKLKGLSSGWYVVVQIPDSAPGIQFFKGSETEEFSTLVRKLSELSVHIAFVSLSALSTNLEQRLKAWDERVEYKATAGQKCREALLSLLREREKV